MKTLLYRTPKETVAVLVRGDHEVNDMKVKKLLAVTELEMADPETVMALTGAPVGFAGPIGLRQARILADHGVTALRNFVVGANEADAHYMDVNCERDFSTDLVADLRKAQAGDPSPRGEGNLKVARGIETGHVFMLGTKYSQAMKATFLDPQGREQLAVMGCYGIGVGRTAAAAIEQNHDDKGIVWPIPIAPFHLHLLPLGPSERVLELARRLYDQLLHADVEVLWDDRDERAGVKFNDADLIGSPYQLLIGDKGLNQGQVECKERKSGSVTKIPPDQVVDHLKALLSQTGPP